MTESLIGRNMRNRPWYSWLFLAMFIVTILTMLYNVIIRTPKAKQVEEQLEREFNSVALFPQATATHSEKSYKDAQALIVTRYSTDASYSVLRDYYDTELSKHGWRFVSERMVTDWGRDLGGKTAHYCKGEWSADVEYMGQDNAGKSDYALALSWGLNECK
jgi:hypothetical protein